ncbi:MAG: hypothetical protein II981_01475 [Bacteroidales bacterium]|nr:hypothetical protein [Bacteroidales bacterium]
MRQHGMPAEEGTMNDRLRRVHGWHFFNSSRYALGIGAASFASAVYEASKDRAESPTACRNAHINS